jgi:hypothetical protein
MKIAQTAPLGNVQPLLYGGIDHLTIERMDLGHEVTWFVNGDSITRNQNECDRSSKEMHTRSTAVCDSWIQKGSE